MVDGEDIIPQQSKSFSSGEMYSIAFIARFLFCCLFSLLSFLYLNSSFQFFFKIRVVVREGKRVLSKNASSLRGDLLRPTMTTRSLVLGDEEVFSLTLSLSLCFSLFVSDNSFVSSQKKNCLCLPLCVSLSLLFSSLLSSLSFFYCLLCCAQNFDPSCAGRLHCSPEMCGATRVKASSNRDAGKSEEYARTRAVRERNPPSGKRRREKSDERYSKEGSSSTVLRLGLAARVVLFHRAHGFW